MWMNGKQKQKLNLLFWGEKKKHGGEAHRSANEESETEEGKDGTNELIR